MFARDDYLDYFREILKLENEMVETYEELAKKLEKFECVKIVKDIRDDEKKHARIAERLMQIGLEIEE